MYGFLYVILSAVSPGDGPPVFQATTAKSDKPVAGTLQALAADWSVRIGETEIPAGDLVELIQLGVARPNFPWDRPHLLLVNGDRWPGRVVGIKDDQLRFVAAFGTLPELTIPITDIAVAWLKSPRQGARPDPSNFELLKDRRHSDEVYLDNQDKLIGSVTSIVGTDCRLERDGKTQVVPVDRIAALAFNTDLAKVHKPARTAGHAVLTSGARLTMVETEWRDGRLVGKTVGGIPFRLLVGDIVALSMRSDRVVWLDDLKPARFDYTPFLSTQWPMTKGRNTKNSPMRTGPHVFDFGIGLHSQSRATFPIPDGVERFESWVGLDMDVGQRGNVRVQVLIDGRAVFGPTDIIGAKVPLRVVAPISKEAHELTLVVEFAGGGDVQDHVNWSDARLIRSGSGR